MALPTNRTTANTAAEHVADHNTLHVQHNAYEGTEPADFEAAGTAAAAVAAHAGAGDPHSGYRLESVPIAAADVAADVATQAELDAAFPWLIDINVFPTAVDQVNWDTLTQAAGFIGGAYKQSTGAQNARIAWDIVLHAGTWDIEMIHHLNNNRGVYSVQLDDVAVGTIEGYAAAPTNNVRTSVTGVVVAASGKKRLALKMLTKHASSSSYFGVISGVTLKRTA